MSKTELVRNEILKNFRVAGHEIATVEIDGNYFSAADVAIKNKLGQIEVYRIAVVENNNSI